jgi:hypothetical protein
MNMSTTPGPGIYENVPFAEYLDWDAVNSSSLLRAEKSMHHFRHGGYGEETDAMRLGTLLHCGKFEPLELMQRYVVMPAFELQIRKPNGAQYENPRSTSAYRDAVKEFKRENAGKTVVLPQELEKLKGVVAALSGHSRARQYLEGAGPTEVCLVWTDPGSGVLCKARLDKLNYTSRVIADFKSSTDISGFEWNIKKWRYKRQAAFYSDGFEVLSGVRLPFTLTAAETVEPYMVRAAPLSERSLKQGRASYQILLAQIAECRASGSWPGYTDPDEWDLPGGDSDPIPVVDQDGNVTRF